MNRTTKNIIVSGCVLYPVKSLCFSNLKWTDIKKVENVSKENEAWTKPLEFHLNKLEVDFEDWHVEKAKIDLSQSPPEGIFYIRMSASSHVRGHRFAPEYTSVIINWLRSHNRRIINDGNALALEISKSLQYLKLSESGIKTPRSIFCSSKEQIIQSARDFKKPFITVHPFLLSSIVAFLILLFIST